jgi:hypothetical protein
MRNLAEVAAWLRKFGYLHEENTIDDAVIAMQKQYGLKQDGDVGPITNRAMSLFRCGHTDAKMIRVAGTTDCKWQKSSLGYYYSDNFKFGNLSAKVSRDVITQAFALWQSYGGLTFYKAKTRSVADIVIDAGSGPKYGFDGIGNVLAWAYMPCDPRDVQLQMMFDLAEPWTISPQGSGIYVLAVVMHEIGHLLGLDHDEMEGALMAAYYNAAVWKPTARDLARYRSIYGFSVPEPPEEPPAPPPTNPPAGGTYRIAGTGRLGADNQMEMSLQLTPDS